MRKILLILCICYTCFQLGACKVKFPNDALNQEQITNTQDEENINNKKGNIEQSDLNLEQEIRTPYYSISIPEDWSYKELETGTLYFMIENEEVGGLYIQSYYSDNSDPLKRLLPNHSEIIESKKLDGFFTEAHKIKIIISPPAASKDIRTENWTYIFLIKDKTTVYEVFLNTDLIDENDILTIAKSFKL